jgi:hypothetical protein
MNTLRGQNAWRCTYLALGFKISIYYHPRQHRRSFDARRRYDRQISSAVCVLSLVRETKFHTPTMSTSNNSAYI